MRTSFHRAIVTGGAGFLGSHLCAELLAGGTAVFCVDNLVTGAVSNIENMLENPGFEFVQSDIADVADSCFVGIGPKASADGDIDLVVHMASPASPARYLELPLETLRAGGPGTTRALELAERHNARFLLVSSSEIYGDPRQHPQREDYWGNVNPVGPRAVYDEAKRYAEALTSAHRDHLATDTRIARVFNSYGPRMRVDDGRMVPTFIWQALLGESITVTGSGEQTRSLCYVDDTVRGLLAVADGDVTSPVNIGNPNEHSVRGLGELIRDLAGSSSSLKYLPPVTDDPRRRCPDISLVWEKLEWRPEIDVNDGLSRTISWFKEEALASQLSSPTQNGLAL